MSPLEKNRDISDRDIIVDDSQPDNGAQLRKKREAKGGRNTSRRSFSVGRRVLAAILALLLLIAIAWAVLWYTPVATLKNVEVTGATNADSKAISEAGGVQIGKQLVRIDTNEVARNVAAEPWVKQVSVGRSWPSTLRIEVKEYAPIMFMRATDGEHLFDDEGEEFTTASPPEGTIELVGAPRVNNPEDGKLDLRPEVIKSVLEVVKHLPPSVHDNVARISAPGANEVTVVLHDGHEFYFGSSDNAAEKAHAAELVRVREELKWNLSNPALPTIQN